MLYTALRFRLFSHFLIQGGKNRLCTVSYWQTVNRISCKSSISVCNITDIKFQSNIRTFLIIFTVQHKFLPSVIKMYRKFCNITLTNNMNPLAP